MIGSNSFVTLQSFAICQMLFCTNMNVTDTVINRFSNINNILPFQPGTCVINGYCFVANDVNPYVPCMKCLPGTSNNSWTPGIILFMAYSKPNLHIIFIILFTINGSTTRKRE